MEAQIEEAIKFRKKANFKILTRLSQIIDQYPYLRFHQILIIYKISELGVDKFNEESVETLKKLEHEMVEKAVKSYENIMAPSNYKRPTALITKKQIEAAQKKVEELGLTDALPRRHARVEDIGKYVRR